MKRGFTLLELVVVILIIGVLATLGLTQYGRVVERSRGAEARAILGDIRKSAVVVRLEYNTLIDATHPFDDNAANIGSADGQIPDTATGCKPSHYFSYGVLATADAVAITATRCTTGGKNPDAANPDTLTLDADIVTGVDAWGGSGNY